MSICAFIGLGNMGYPMAGHLVAAGHEVRVFNRTSAVAERWGEQHDGTVVATPGEAADGAEFVFTCVGADDDLRAVVLGDDGALGTMPAGSVLVDHTTASAEVARELAEVCASRGIGWLDAP
ncbi:MAG: NAD(P)-binding domain-containing protein, partial [bacterium]|nr:NAD(P)-binding domain-containing protein [bacterium]